MITLAGTVTAPLIEDLARRLSSPPPTLEIDISGLKRLQLFADSRLHGLLALMRQKRCVIHVLQNRAPMTDASARSYWRLFTQTATGLVLRSYANCIFDKDRSDFLPQVSELQDRTLTESRGIVSYGKEITVPLYGPFGFPAPNRVFVKQDTVEDLASARLKTLLRQLGVSLSDHVHQNCVNFVEESLQNAEDHGGHDLARFWLGGLATLTLRRLTPKEATTDLASSTGAIREYIQRLEEGGELTKNRRLLEVIVTDGGLGVPMHFSRTENIYRLEPHIEEQALMGALKWGATTLRKKPGAGLGFYKIIWAANESKGLLLIRTGRLLMYRHYGQKDSLPPDKLVRDDSGFKPLLAGTSVSLLFPYSP